MDKSTIVIWANVVYCLIYLPLLIVRTRQYSDKVHITNNNPKIEIEYTAYSLSMGLTLLFMIFIPLYRNNHVFNYSLPLTFVAQFVVQLLIVLFFIFDTKITRYMATYSIAGFLVFMFINGLFLMEPRYSKLELTTQEVHKLSKDLDGFSDEISNRIEKVNNDMNAVVFEIKERQKQIETVNQLLKEKENEYQTVRTKLEVDKEKASEILTALGVKSPTLGDRLIDAGIGAVLGLLLSVIWNRLFSKCNPVSS